MGGFCVSYVDILVVLQSIRLLVLADLLVGLGLDLSDSLSGNPEQLTHFLKRMLDAVHQTVSQLQDSSLLVGQLLQNLVDLVLEDSS